MWNKCIHCHGLHTTTQYHSGSLVLDQECILGHISQSSLCVAVNWSVVCGVLCCCLSVFNYTNKIACQSVINLPVESSRHPLHPYSKTYIPNPWIYYHNFCSLIAWLRGLALLWFFRSHFSTVPVQWMLNKHHVCVLLPGKFDWNLIKAKAPKYRDCVLFSFSGWVLESTLKHTCWRYKVSPTAPSKSACLPSSFPPTGF